MGDLIKGDGSFLHDRDEGLVHHGQHYWPRAGGGSYGALPEGVELRKEDNLLRLVNAKGALPDQPDGQLPPDRKPEFLGPPPLLLYNAAGDFRVQRIVEELNIRQAELARAAGVSPKQVSSWCAAEAVRPESEQARAILAGAAKVLVALSIVYSSAEKRQIWLQNPNAAFRGERPIELILQGRSEEVFRVLEPVVTGDISL